MKTKQPRQCPKSNITIAEIDFCSEKYILVIKNVVKNFKKYFQIKKKWVCIDGESNPGHPRGRRVFYHWTINACVWWCSHHKQMHGMLNRLNYIIVFFSTMNNRLCWKSLVSKNEINYESIINDHTYSTQIMFTGPSFMPNERSELIRLQIYRCFNDL